MARQQLQGRLRNEIGYREIELLKQETLGVGSYGSVCKAKCDHLLCAAKIIHPTLVPTNVPQQISPQREHRLPIKRFMMECDFLSGIKHPNIIQYLGMYQDPETGLPVLLMELMDESLTHFLEASTQPIPYHVQLAISLDIIRALSYLHLNGVIHRDLSSNNILLIGNVRAKLTDFGMAKLVDMHTSNTVCPGTDAYMPPEAINNQAVYTEKGDVFSFGVNIIQILTRKFPKPSDRFDTVPTDDPRFPSGLIRVCVPEIERRNNHISEVKRDHPLLLIAQDCLNDQETKRPSAGELCQRLTALKDTPKYTESEKEDRCMTHQMPLAEKDGQIIELRQQLLSQEQIAADKQQEYNEQTQQYQNVLTVKQQKIQSLREEVSRAVREKEETIAIRHQQQREHEEILAQLQRRIQELELLVYSKPQPETQSLPLPDIGKVKPPPKPPRGHSQSIQRLPSTSGEGEVFRLKWTKGRKAPRKMSRFTDAVMGDNVAYFRPSQTRQVYSYNLVAKSWSQLPDCLIEHTTLAIIGGLLTTVGGHRSNKLLSLTGEGKGRKWTEVFPSMTTARSSVTAVTTGSALIVAGGLNYERPVTNVEIMNTNMPLWSIATSLPQAMHEASATVCGDCIYMCDEASAIMCSLPALLHSCRPKVLEAQLSTPTQKDSVWSTIAGLKVTDTTLVSINNCLLAIGGRDSENITTAIRLYDPVSDCWQTISHLSKPRRWCFAVVLPNNKIMVVGGRTTRYLNSETDSVEFGDF